LIAQGPFELNLPGSIGVTRNPQPRIRMIDGFDEVGIDFADQGCAARKGSVTMESVIAELAKASRGKATA